MTAPSSVTPARPRRGWTVLTGALVALTVALGIVAVPWFLIQERAAPLAPAGPRWFGSYVDVTQGGAASSLSGGSSSDAVVLAFVGAASANACTASWGGAYSLADAARILDLDRRIARVQQSGRTVAVSFGGTGFELAGACASVGDLAGAYASVLDRYAVTTMDLDLGVRSLDDPAAGDRRAQAVAQLQANHRARGAQLAVWLTLPAGRGGLSTGGLRSIRQLQQAGVRLSGINAMTGRDDAPQDGQPLGAAAIAALTAVHDQLGRLYDELNVDLPVGGVWAIMGATPTIGRVEGEDRVFALDDAAALNAFAQKQRLARLSMWSTNRDPACTPATDPGAGACRGTLPQDDAFAAVLGRGLGAATDQAASAPPSTTAPASPASTPAPSPDP